MTNGQEVRLKLSKNKKWDNIFCNRGEVITYSLIKYLVYV